MDALVVEDAAVDLVAEEGDVGVVGEAGDKAVDLLAEDGAAGGVGGAVEDEEAGWRG